MRSEILAWRSRVAIKGVLSPMTDLTISRASPSGSKLPVETMAPWAAKKTPSSGIAASRRRFISSNVLRKKA